LKKKINSNGAITKQDIEIRSTEILTKTQTQIIILFDIIGFLDLTKPAATSHHLFCCLSSASSFDILRPCRCSASEPHQLRTARTRLHVPRIRELYSFQRGTQELRETEEVVRSRTFELINLSHSLSFTRVVVFAITREKWLY